MTRWVLLAMLLAAPALAEPPDNAGPDADWYRSLAQPATGYGCCSVADCRAVLSRITAGHYAVWIGRDTFRDGDDAWHDVPDGVVIRDRVNPTGGAVACWYQRTVRCFVAGMLI